MSRYRVIGLATGTTAAVAYGYRRGLGIVAILVILTVTLIGFALWHWIRSYEAGDDNPWDFRFDLVVDLPVTVELARRVVERALTEHAKSVTETRTGEFSARTAAKPWIQPVWPVSASIESLESGSRVRLGIRYEDGMFDSGACARKLTVIRDAIVAESQASQLLEA